MTQPSPTPDPSRRQQRTIKLLYWIAAAAMAITIALGFANPPVNYLELGTRLALLVALVLLATAQPTESRAKKVVIYALVLIAAVLLVVRIAR